MQCKRYMPAVLGGAAGLLLLVLLTVLAFTVKPSDRPSVARPESSSFVPAPSVAGTTYILREWNGKMAVFLADVSSPQTVYDVYVSTFPPEEQNRLAEGIVCHGEEELIAWIENYTS